MNGKPAANESPTFACYSESSEENLSLFQDSGRINAHSCFASLNMTQIKSKIAAVIPAYNEEKHIGDVVRRTRQKLDDVLVVDDGSVDKTADSVEKPARR